MFMIILAHSGAPEEYTWLYNPFFLSAFSLYQDIHLDRCKMQKNL